MTAVTHEGDAHTEYEAATDPGHDEHHPSDATYWKVGGILGLLTLLEVGTYFITDDPYSHELAPLLIGSLLFMMVAKFITIGAYFMHLKFDSKLFRTAFITGIVLAVAVYIAVLTTFTFWDDGYEEGLRLLAS